MFTIKVTACLHFGPKQIPPTLIEWLWQQPTLSLPRIKPWAPKIFMELLIVTDGNTIFYDKKPWVIKWESHF